MNKANLFFQMHRMVMQYFAEVITAQAINKFAVEWIRKTVYSNLTMEQAQTFESVPMMVLETKNPKGIIVNWVRILSYLQEQVK